MFANVWKQPSTSWLMVLLKASLSSSTFCFLAHADEGFLVFHILSLGDSIRN